MIGRRLALFSNTIEMSVICCRGKELNSHLEEGAEVVVEEGSIRHPKYPITYRPDWHGQSPPDGVFTVVGFDEVDNVVTIANTSETFERSETFELVDFRFPCPNGVNAENNMVYPRTMIGGGDRDPRPREWGVVGDFCCKAHMLGHTTKKMTTKKMTAKKVETPGVVKTSPMKRQPKAKPKPKAEPKAEPKPKAKPKPKAEPKAEPKPKAESRSKRRPSPVRQSNRQQMAEAIAMTSVMGSLAIV